jgi:hypothetical protein
MISFSFVIVKKKHKKLSLLFLDRNKNSMFLKEKHSSLSVFRVRLGGCLIRLLGHEGSSPNWSLHRFYGLPIVLLPSGDYQKHFSTNLLEKKSAQEGN